MSGFTIRRFVLQNITAVAAHCPSVTVASTAVAVMTGVAAPPTAPASSPASSSSGASSVVSSWVRNMLTGAPDASSLSSTKTGFGLVTAEEMEWIRRRRREGAEESRVVLATRPGRSVLRGVAGGALNSCLGFIVSPLVFLAVALELVRLGNGVSSLLTGPCYGFVWGGIFFACAQYAAAQQVLMCGYYSCVATPLYYCVNRRPLVRADATPMMPAPRARAWIFGALSCRFEVPQGTLHAHHPMLLLYDAPSVLRERAMKRLAHRDKSKSKKEAQYAGKGKANGAGPDDDDYYGLLGLSPDATPRQVKEAYSQKALHLHPDRNPNPDAARQFDRVTKAYRVLSNPQKRRKFDLAGTKGVEDTGVKKREGVRALFGGAELNKLAGDAFLGSFSQRVIDGLDFTAEELAVIRQHMYESCRDELLGTYLAHYDASAAATTDVMGGSVKRAATVAATKSGPWKGDAVALQLRKMLNTGLAKEVLYTIGHEYQRVIACFDMEDSGSASLPSLAMQRAKFYASVSGPHRWHLQRRKVKYLTTVRSHTFKNSEAMVDLAWFTSVQELETTARHVALMILYEPSLSATEATTRRNALAALAESFIMYGQPYKGASKATMDQLMSSLREYQQQRQREKDSE
ncbi:putative mitochondrial chaperone protein DNAj [Leptomonas pyrrhocoris]|uniref:Putative mitochondrial chaperone protein DNAj n=1 Tax=Leptomonas pyrrhocoris TaxID=157538 RepID=A0A0M9GBA3_LEPPY|nr:putative mitochondrial chaperone protein DNAj [Leptomonas pyrrhocoris]KPA86870.1 putative mitochondrial chaperone protein DNAj [Leptomonas pyrrhocoris]|eukprot:XP_015665309.1 putative mitochondrial chaperone protein DNAj [Leptomonas pyrrhocoris]